MELDFPTGKVGEEREYFRRRWKKPKVGEKQISNGSRDFRYCSWNLEFRYGIPLSKSMPIVKLGTETFCYFWVSLANF